MDSPILVESRALEAALAVVEGQGDPALVSSSIQTMLSLWQPDGSPGDLAKQVAVHKIAGDSLPTTTWTPTGSGPEDRKLFEMVVHAWIAWVSGTQDLFESHVEGPPSRGDGLIHRMALGYWAGAVENLTRHDLVEARRLFRRAAELGGQFGTESNPVVLWTYAASFWNQKPS
jgi:hypothetical protein